MSSFPLFSTQAVRRPVAAASAKFPALSERLSSLSAEVTSASHLEVCPMPEMVSSGVVAIDALTGGGFPRGRLTEVCGSASSGRTSLALAVLAAATRRQEACALVDVSDAFDPMSATIAGVQFERLLWVRCGSQQTAAERRKNTAHGASRGYESQRNPALKGQNKNHEDDVEQALRVTDLLLQSGGFGLLMIDLSDVPFKIARRIPLASWFRFQRAVEHTPTVLFVITPAACTQSCATLLLKVAASGKKLSAISSQLSENPASTVEAHGFSHAVSSPEKPRALAPDVPTHTQLLDGFHVEGELLRSRLGRKPPQPVTAAFATKVRAG